MKPSIAGRLAAHAAVLLVACGASFAWASEAVGSDAPIMLESGIRGPDLSLSWRARAAVRFGDDTHATPATPATVDAGALTDLEAGVFDARGMLAEAQRQAAGPSLIKLYRDALMEETRRSMRRDPSLFWLESFDGVDADLHEGLTMHRARRSAEKIFGEAHQELLAGALNHLIETTGPLNALNHRIRGIDFRVRADSSQGITRFDSETTAQGSRRNATNFSFVVSNKPRLEMERLLPGRIKASVEVPLLNPGLRTTFSRRIAGSMRGTLSFGVEDMGEDYWVSAGVRCGF